MVFKVCRFYPVCNFAKFMSFGLGTVPSEWVNLSFISFNVSRETVGLYFHDDPVYGLSVHPEDNNVFLTACDDGNVLLWDARTATGT